MKADVKVILLSLTTVLLLVFPIQQVSGLFKFKKLHGVVNENPKPKLTAQHWIDHSFQDDAEAYLQQHYGFREPLTRLYNQYLWDFYGLTFAKERNWVFVSDDGWYYESNNVREYYEGNSWKYASDSLKMAQILGKEALMLSQIQQILSDLDTHLFVVLEPGKELVCPEHIPANKVYHHDKVFSAHHFLHQRFETLGINYIDIGEWFLQMKDTADFPLFPQTGTHWSNLAAMYVGDSLIRYMEALGNMNILNYEIGPKYAKTKEPDNDLEEWLNLMRPLKGQPNYYATTRIVDDPTAAKPKLITIGDSFYWNITNHTPFRKIFGSTPYWYYFSTAYFDGPDKSVADLDLLEEVAEADFVMLAYSTPQQYEMSNGFAKRFLMEWCYDDDEIEPLLLKMKERIRNDKPWMGRIVEKAESQGLPVDSVLDREATYFVEKRPEACFAALADSVPLKRSSKAEHILLTQKGPQQ